MCEHDLITHYLMNQTFMEQYHDTVVVLGSSTFPHSPSAQSWGNCLLGALAYQLYRAVYLVYGRGSEVGEFGKEDLSLERDLAVRGEVENHVGLSGDVDRAAINERSSDQTLAINHYRTNSQ